MKFKEYYLLKENDHNLIERVKNYLIESRGSDGWKNFVDGQELGDCQFIAKWVSEEFPEIKHVFGHILLDKNIYIQEDDEETDQLTHHWNEYRGEIVEFSKGTLQHVIKFENLYSVECEDESRYFDIIFKK